MPARITAETPASVVLTMIPAGRSELTLIGIDLDTSV
jgi:hypothetical protein